MSKGDPNRSEGFDTGVDSTSIEALQKSAVSQIAAAVAHLPREIASQFVAAASSQSPTFGSVPNGDYKAQRSGVQGATKGGRTGSPINTPPGGENG